MHPSRTGRFWDRVTDALQGRDEDDQEARLAIHGLDG